MSLIDEHFKEALKSLPEKKLSWRVDRTIRKMLRLRANELDGIKPFWTMFKKLVAVPVAFVLLFSTTTGYAYYSPSVVQGDLLYGVKISLEQSMYPIDGSSEERIAYHLWLSDRRYAELTEILERFAGESVVLVPTVYASSAEEVAILSKLLQDTLRRATQNVEYALLITDEIRDIHRLDSVKNEIRSSIKKQKILLEKIAPVLKEVKLFKKEKSRQKELKKVIKIGGEESLPPKDGVITEADLIITEEDIVVDEEPEVIEEVIIEDLPDETELFVKEEAKDEVNVIEMIIEAEEEMELDDMEELAMDLVAFQEAILQDLEEVIEGARVEGKIKVVVNVDEKWSDVSSDEGQADYELFNIALAVHYEVEQQVLLIEVEELEKVLIVQVETDKLALGKEFADLSKELFSGKIVVPGEGLAIGVPALVGTESPVSVPGLEVAREVVSSEVFLPGSEEVELTVVVPDLVAIESEDLLSEEPGAEADLEHVDVDDEAVVTVSVEDVAEISRSKEYRECERDAKKECEDSEEIACAGQFIKKCVEDKKMNKLKKELKEQEKERREKLEKHEKELKDKAKKKKDRIEKIDIKLKEIEKRKDEDKDDDKEDKDDDDEDDEHDENGEDEDGDDDRDDGDDD